MILSMVKWIYRIGAVVIALILLWANVVIHRTPHPGDPVDRARVLAQFHYLKGRMHEGAPQEMQGLFPEGAPFAYALHGLASCNLSSRVDGALRQELLDEARWCLEQLDSDDVKGRFPALLPPDHGAFLSGWTAYLHGNMLRALAATERTEDDIARFRSRCDTIARTFINSDQPFIESYNGMAWPADAMVCIAALTQHDALFSPAYSSVIQDWVRDAKGRLDERGMLPHAWDPVRDVSRSAARGSSMALMNVFLPAIDHGSAEMQFTLFRQHFLTERFGLPAVREHREGTHGAGDIDSGPLIMGIGPAATIVAVGACRMNGDAFHAHEFASVVEAFGFAVGRKERAYLFGALPIADLFIVWCRSMPYAGAAQPFSSPLFLRFHAWSALALLLVFAPWSISAVRKRVKNQKAVQ